MTELSIGPVDADLSSFRAPFRDLALNDGDDLIMMLRYEDFRPSVITPGDPAQRHFANDDVSEAGARLDRELVIFVVCHSRLPIIFSEMMVAAGGRRVQ
jgi:hypothetical protein